MRYETFEEYWARTFKPGLLSWPMRAALREIAEQAWKAARTPLLSWEGAPEWASYMAVDSDGSVFYYEYEPTQEQVSWLAHMGRLRPVLYAQALACPFWKETLEKRPCPVSTS